ncbi:aldolase [Sphingopyxis sp. BSNA05]|uniref:HPr kinase/phosphorylase n=1 Tax=Sphingopyxis sp. BSNA05 TaxID=1236614 RepID=UPI001566D4A8|nr:HPr kinase/phosphatase C-terminal domain-containing protein [Sphingopyxis sp. BSNA05]NRD90770.1 aldolase [Sphingopyxis sp. BSNA05]
MSDSDDSGEATILHATAVAIAGVGLLIRGNSGSGKSDLALRLIDRGAVLVSDDQVAIRRADQALLLSPPASLAGKLEVRSLGILQCEHVSGVELKLVIDLKDQVDRYPMDRQLMILLGMEIPSCTLDAMETSAAIKAELAMQRIMQGAIIS